MLIQYHLPTKFIARKPRIGPIKERPIQQSGIKLRTTTATSNRRPSTLLNNNCNPATPAQQPTMAEEAPQEVPAPAEAAPEAPPMSAATAITVEPVSIQVSASGGNANINLQNGNPGGRYAFKVKSTNNEHYRVNPVYGFVESSAAVQVEVTRLNGPAKADDRLEILFQPADAGLADPKAPFAGGAAAEHKQEVTMIAA